MAVGIDSSGNLYSYSKEAVKKQAISKYTGGSSSKSSSHSSGSSSSSSSKKRAAAKLAAEKAAAEKAAAEKAAAEKAAKILLDKASAEKAMNDKIKSLGYQEVSTRNGVKWDGVTQRESAKEIYNNQQTKNEQTRIDNLYEKAKSNGSSGKTKIYTDADSGDKIKITTTSVNKIVNGVKTEFKIIQRENLNTGELDVKTYEYNRKTRKTSQTGGLNYGKGSSKSILSKKELINVISNEKTRLDAGIRSGKLTPKEGQQIYNAFKSARITEYNKNQSKTKTISGIVTADNKTEVGKYITTIKSKFNKVSMNFNNSFKNIDKDLTKLYAESKTKRINLNAELEPIKEARAKEMTAVQTELDNKLSNAVSKSDISKAYKEATEKIKDIKVKYQGKGMNLENKIIGETMKSVGYSFAGFGVSLFNGVKDYSFNKQSRDNINQTIKTLATNKESRQAVYTIVEQEFNRTALMAKTNPGEALVSIGGDLLLGTMVGKAFKPLAKISKKAIKGVVKVSGKTIRKVKVIDDLIRYSGKVVKISKSKGENIIKVTGNKVIPKKLKASLKKTKKLKASRDKILKKGKLPSSEDYKIKGVKVTKKEFKSFELAEKKFKENSKYAKMIKPLKNGKLPSISDSRRIKISTLSTTELNYLKGLLNIKDKSLLSGVKYIDVTRVSTKLKLMLPNLKRIITKSPSKKKISEGIWRFQKKEKTLYENIVSYGLIDQKGKYISSLTFSNLSTKAIDRFSNTATAIKYGINKQLTISKQAGKSYIQSFVKSMDKRLRPKIDLFISKYKTKPLKKLNIQTSPITSVKVNTRAVLSGSTIKDQFKLGTKVSKTKLLEKTKKIKVIDKAKKGLLQLSKENDIKISAGYSDVERVIKDVDIGQIRKAIKNLKNIKKIIPNKIKTLENNVKILKRKAIIIKNNYRKTSVKLRSNIYKTESKQEIKNINKKLDKAFSNTQTQLGNIQKRIVRERLSLKREITNLKKLSSQKYSRVSAYSKVGSTKLKFNKKLIGLSNLKKEIKQIDNYKKAIMNLRKKKLISLTKKTLMLSKIKAVKLALNNLSKTKSLQEFKKAQLKATSTKQALKNASKKLQKSITTTKSLNITPTTPKPISPIVKKIITIPKKKKKSLYIRTKSKETISTKKLSKPVMTYKVYVKKRGKNVLIGQRLTQTDAKNLLAYDVDNTLLRSAVIKPQSKLKVVTKLPIKYNGAFSKRQSKFRQYKIQQKKKKPIKGFIEKQKYSADTKREKKQLSRARKKKIVIKKKTKSKRKKK